MNDTSVVDIFHQGGIIAYPTEAVFGFGCDPDNEQAIEKLLSLKQRSKDKGLILLAGHYSQLLPYIDESEISQEQLIIIKSRWPAAITQIMPAKTNISPLLSGNFSTIAVRVTQHPVIIELCQRINKPIISTSANLSGEETLTSWQAVKQQFSDQVDYIIEENTLGLTKPSSIIDALTSKVLRP